MPSQKSDKNNRIRIIFIKIIIKIIIISIIIIIVIIIIISSSIIKNYTKNTDKDFGVESPKSLSKKSKPSSPYKAVL